VSDDAPLKRLETAMFDAVREALTQVRMTRDKALEQLFDLLYGSNELPRHRKMGGAKASLRETTYDHAGP
jgi:hypothetical protein